MTRTRVTRALRSVGAGGALRVTSIAPITLTPMDQPAGRRATQPPGTATVLTLPRVIPMPRLYSDLLFTPGEPDPDDDPAAA